MRNKISLSLLFTKFFLTPPFPLLSPVYLDHWSACSPTSLYPSANFYTHPPTRRTCSCTSASICPVARTLREARWTTNYRSALRSSRSQCPSPHAPNGSSMWMSSSCAVDGCCSATPGVGSNSPHGSVHHRHCYCRNCCHCSRWCICRQGVPTPWTSREGRC